MTPARWQQIEELYHAALECDPGERAALLARADPELRREVESLLAQDSSKTGALDQLAWVGAAGFTSANATVTLITAGTQLGPYKIEGPLGSGGMGEVFRARDTRLGRAVAIKTLQEQFSARFDREARAISSLNHPHICTLYDVGPNYLVMELCEGETLTAHLKRGKLSVQETISYGAQVADALAAAHAKGITHRDLKPGNIMLGKAGIKVLDFGLAKSPEDLTLTGTRMVMGTPGYMAPEQREGKDCDARTDIYALGLILYEMGTGKRGEQGQTPLLDELPEKLAHVIKRCLTQDPDDRWQSARDVQRELEWAAISKPLPEVAPEPGDTQRRPRLAWSVAALAIVGLASVAFLYYREQPPASATPMRFQIPAPENTTLGALLSLSPDGRKLAFIAGGRVWVHFLESGDSRDLADGGGTPFWSPDSRFIGYTSEGKLKKIEATGGLPQTVAEFTGFWGGGTWNKDDVILFSNRRLGLFRVPASGGVPVQITAQDRAGQEISHYAPIFLPDGRHFIYIRAFSDREKSAIYLGSLDAKPGQQSSKLLVASNWDAVYAPSADSSTGYLLFMRQGNLMAQPFDSRRLEMRGQAEPVAEQVGDNGGGIGGHAAISASANDVLVFQRRAASDRQLTWYDREGKVTGTVGEPSSEYRDLALSPDGTRLAMTKSSGADSVSIWLADLSRGGASTRFTFGSPHDLYQVWSPDGSRLVFSSDRDGQFNLYQKLVNGAKDEEVLLKSSEDKRATSWSSDGRFLLYEVDHPQNEVGSLGAPVGGQQEAGPVPGHGVQRAPSSLFSRLPLGGVHLG